MSPFNITINALNETAKGKKKNIPASKKQNYKFKRRASEIYETRNSHEVPWAAFS